MKIYPAILCLLFSSATVFGQITGLKWQRSIGGTGSERFCTIRPTRGGQLISAGYTNSIDGDGTGNHGSTDVLLSAANKNGIVQWTKQIGGTADDGGLDEVSVDTLTDGNMILAFGSASNNGDVSGNHGSYDLVFRKYTPAGQLLWSKTYGGSGTEFMSEVKATADGGCIAIGSTTSNNNGDVGPNHGANTFDTWIVKLDAAGSIQWQKCYGGTAHDGERQGSIAATPDGGYVFTTTVGSTDGDLAGLVPAGTAAGVDVWLAKINANGGIQWSKQIGGSDTEDVPVLTCSGTSVYLSFGSRSNNRDLTSNAGLFDVALFKYSLSGTFVWKGVYGGTAWDSPTAIAQNVDGNLSVTAVTYSSQINGTSVVNRGQADILLLRIDSATGTMRWAKTFGGTGGDFSYGLFIDANGDHYLAGTSESNNYDISGNKGLYDAILVGVVPGNTITGTVYIDNNNNGTLDASDTKPNYVQVKTTRRDVFQTTTLTLNGVYSLDVDTGQFVTSVALWKPQYYTLQPDSFTTTFTGSYQTTTQNIRLKPVAGIRDLRVTAFPLGAARPAFATDYLVLGYNTGTDTVASGTLSFRKDPRVSYTSFSVPPSATFGDSVVWNFTNLKPFDSLRFKVKITTPPPPAVTAGDLLKFSTAISSPATDIYPGDNRLELYHVLVGPLDPNEKMNLNAGRFTQAQLQNGDYINYVIHFQNVGTASAFDVIVRDTLSSKLIAASIETMAASHPFVYTQRGTEAVWRFKNINLPDSTSDKEGSKGFVALRIKARGSLALGDTVGNKAAIYFDYNEPVVTNTDTLRIVATPVCNAVTNNSVSVTTTAFCGTANGILIDGTATGGGNGAPAYQWQQRTGTSSFTGISGATAQRYTTATLTQTTQFRRYVVSGCASDTSNVVTLTVNPLPPVPAIIQTGNVLASSASTGNQWHANGVAIAGATGQFYTALASGTYTVSATVNGCTTVSNPVVLAITAVNTPSLLSAIKILPNPVQDKLLIQRSGAGQLLLQLWDASGKKLLFKTFFTASCEMDFTPYSSGAYIVQVLNPRTGERMQRLIVK